MEGVRHWVRAWRNRLRGSLFYIPALYIVAALLLARVLVWIDDSADLEDVRLIVDSTVGGARALLGTAAGATITVAGIVFSVTVVSVQLASSQFSPRVLSTFLRDRFTQNVIGFVVGTFSYCLVVLAVVSPSDAGGVEVTQRRLSVTVALALAVLAILAIVAFIDHSARSMQVGEVIRGIADDTLDEIEQLYSKEKRGKNEESAKAEKSKDDQRGEKPDGAVAGAKPALPSGEGTTARAARDGWVRRIDVSALIELVPPGGVVRVETRVGAFVAQQLPLATVWPEPDDLERFASRVGAAIEVERSRSPSGDPTFGIRQLVDIALRALSPGINDPTTANEVLVHLSGIVREVLTRELPSRIVTKPDGGRLWLKHYFGRGDYVRAAFGEIRVAAADQPAVLATLVRVLAGLDALLAANEGKDLSARAQPLRREANLVLEALADTTLLEDDVERLRAMAEAVTDEK